MLDMNMAEHREVRVTARQSIRKDFIAPDLSPVSLLDRELEKGKAGWTDTDVKVTDLTGHHLPTGLVERQLEEMKVGTVITRKGEVRTVARKRPTTRRWK